MENNLEQGKEIVNNSKPGKTYSLAELNEIVKMITEKKDEVLSSRGELKVLAAHELSDTKKMTNNYKIAVERNNATMDLIVDIKDNALRFKLISNRIDIATSLGQEQVRQIEYLIKVLNEVLGILREEEKKLDRVIRFYERNYNSYV
ncbi:MAG: hypothetical protein J6T15_04675 [Bacilli bacterium]|nr:hypothetical protein [Bacilli bacterium]